MNACSFPSIACQNHSLNVDGWGMDSVANGLSLHTFGHMSKQCRTDSDPNPQPEQRPAGWTPSLLISSRTGMELFIALHKKTWIFGIVFSAHIFFQMGSGYLKLHLYITYGNSDARLQLNPDSKDALGEMRKVYVEEGAMALWKGVDPGMARAAALTSSQLATYDESKRVRSIMVAGIVSTLMTAPIDTVKTRLMLQKESGGPGSYRNGFHCGYQIMRTEGPRALYKGGFTTFCTIGATNNACRICHFEGYKRMRFVEELRWRRKREKGEEKGTRGQNWKRKGER
ncbi:Dicarboxylate carrier SLC25A8-like protein, partial [Drosera capensis]